MSENAFIINRETKTFDKPKGCEEYSFPEKFATEILQKADINIFKSIINGIIEEEEEEEEEEVTSVAVQRLGTTFEITQRPETVSFLSLGFPPSISHHCAPSVIQWCDRIISLQSYDENGITLYPSLLGADDFPMKVGIEVAGYFPSIPAVIYDPFVYPDLRADRGVFVIYYDENGFTLQAYQTEIDEFPITVGVFIRGKANGSDTERQEWYVEVTMASKVQSFNYEDINFGSIDDYTYDVPITLEEPSQTFSWHQLKDLKGNTLPTYLDNPRISHFGFKNECGGYIYECTGESVTIKRMHWWVDDLPVKFNLQVRGGVNA